MPLIILKFKDKVIQEYPMEIGQTLTIGRHESNDIVIDNMAISGEHARIDSVSATFIITDLESTNGTFVNDELVSSHGLRHQDRILIGKHEMVFDRSDLERGPDPDGEDLADNKTRVLDTAEYRDLINKTTGKAAPPAPEPDAKTGSGESGGFFSRLLKTLFG
jgi:pSer/pThr/pTyr-binding forkhead associated (FHA) protein